MIDKIGLWLIWWMAIVWLVQVGPDVLGVVRTFAHTTLGSLLALVLVGGSTLLLLPEPDDTPSHVTEQKP